MEKSFSLKCKNKIFSILNVTKHWRIDQISFYEYIVINMIPVLVFAPLLLRWQLRTMADAAEISKYYWWTLTSLYQQSEIFCAMILAHSAKEMYNSRFEENM